MAAYRIGHMDCVWGATTNNGGGKTDDKILGDCFSGCNVRLADGRYGSAGINVRQKASGSHVLVTPGTYDENINFRGKAINVISDGPDTLGQDRAEIPAYIRCML